MTFHIEVSRKQRRQQAWNFLDVHFFPVCTALNRYTFVETKVKPHLANTCSLRTQVNSQRENVCFNITYNYYSK